jgi:hypothetical protein
MSTGAVPWTLHDVGRQPQPAMTYRYMSATVTRLRYARLLGYGHELSLGC